MLDAYHCCTFTCIDETDENPIRPLAIPAPAIGSMFFFEGESHGYRVVDVQYQLRRGANEKLIMVNVILDKVAER